MSRRTGRGPDRNPQGSCEEPAVGSVNKRKKHGVGESSGVGPRRVMEPTRSAAPEHKGLMTPDFRLPCSYKATCLPDRAAGPHRARRGSPNREAQ